jgi:menaquinone-specific isochorismate synthase
MVSCDGSLSGGALAGVRSFSTPAPAGFDPCARALADGGGWFACFENPARKSVHVAAGALWRATFAGPGRFHAARAAAAGLPGGMPSTPDATAPRVFCAFNFEDEAEPGAAFAPATLFLPRWQYIRLPGRPAMLTHNELRKDVEAPVFPGTPGAAGRACGSPCGELGGAWFARGVSQALGEIAAGRVEKVVLARAWRTALPDSFSLCAALALLRGKHPRCTTFAFGNGTGAVFLGATPELLLEAGNGVLRTEALAGTAPRGATPAEDAALAAALLASDKERREHATVVHAIAAALRGCGVPGTRAGRARVARFNGVQHLWTPMSARLPSGAHLLDLAAALHPSPALGGAPRPAALALIRALEPAPRGPYAGPVGWFDGTGAGRLHVGIRSALVAGGEAVFHAGAGVVAGASPEAELAETCRKAAVIREILGMG